MVTSVVVAALALLAPLQAQKPDSTGTVQGIVRSEGTGEPLGLAVVEIDGERPSITMADSMGRYVLHDVPAGIRVVRVSRFDHSPLEIEVLVPSGGRVALDFLLVQRPVVLPEIVAEASPSTTLADTVNPSAPELSIAITRAIESTPGVIEVGLGQVAPMLPGQEPIDPSDVLYVRGAPADMKLVLLDGAPVYAPFHLGGLIPAFDQELLRSADLHLGGAPARYDGGLSYVLGLETRAGRRTHLQSSGSVDLLSTRALIEGPVTRDAGFMVGSRVVHPKVGSWFVGGALPYDYADLLTRIDAELGADVSIALTGFWNHEAVRLDDAQLDNDRAEWGNRAASLRLRGSLGESQLDIVAAVGDYGARLPLQGAAHTDADGRAVRTRLGVDLSRRWSTTRLQYGWSFERLGLEYMAKSQAAQSNAILIQTRADAAVMGSYVDVGWTPVEHLRIRGGLRGDIFSTDNVVRFAPRFSATWVASDRATLTVAAGRYRQLIRPTEPHLRMDGESIRSLHTSAEMGLARASHLVVAIDQELGEGIRLGIEGYYKHFDDVPVADTTLVDPGPHAYQTTTTHAANGSGVDVWLRRGEGRYTGWLGYSLGWVWTADGAPATEHFAGRQLLSLGFTGPLVEVGRFDLRISYGAGLPYSAIPRVELGEGPAVLSSGRSTSGISTIEHVTINAPPLTATPDAPYLRVDFEISRPWSGKWNGRQMSFTPYLKVLNALDRRDALFYAVGGEGDRPAPLAALPILPVLGFSWKF